MKRLAVCLWAGTCAVALVLGVGCSDEKPAPSGTSTATTNNSGAATPTPSLGVVGDPQYFEEESDDWLPEQVSFARDAEDGTALVVEGRISDVNAEYHVLWLVDRSVDYCGKDNADDMCKTPWDF